MRMTTCRGSSYVSILENEIKSFKKINTVGQFKDNTHRGVPPGEAAGDAAGPDGAQHRVLAVHVADDGLDGQEDHDADAKGDGAIGKDVEDQGDDVEDEGAPLLDVVQHSGVAGGADVEAVLHLFPGLGRRPVFGEGGGGGETKQ